MLSIDIAVAGPTDFQPANQADAYICYRYLLSSEMEK